MLKYFKPISSTTTTTSATTSTTANSNTNNNTIITSNTTKTTTITPSTTQVTTSTTVLPTSPSKNGNKKRTLDDLNNTNATVLPGSKSKTSLSSTDQEIIAIANKEKELLQIQALTSPTAAAQLELLQNSQPAIDLTTEPEPTTVTKIARISASSSAITSSSSITSKVVIPTEEEKAILTQFGLSTDSSWAPVVLTEIRKPYFTSLLTFLTETRKKNPTSIYPPQNQVFSALSLTPLDNVKVVILGQDPYHGPGQAHGLAFSVPKGIALPPSLVNILKEVEADIHNNTSNNKSSKISHGNLEYWARQGVLLLNAVLTVEKSQPNSHAKKGWENFTSAILKAVAERTEHVVFLCWGAPAQERAKFISRTRHCVLEAPHPSPLSVYRGFSGCKHFSKANAYLEKFNKVPIHWSLEENK